MSVTPSPSGAHSLLEVDIALLTSMLDKAVLEGSGVEAVAVVRELREAAIAMREGKPGYDRERLSARIAQLDLDGLTFVARAFTLWFHLINAAEEHHRVRLLRRYDREHPANDSLAKAFDTMIAEGLSADDLLAQLQRLYVMPVLTAHPTEARRRTLRDHVADVRNMLDALQAPSGPRAREDLLERLQLVITVLYGTEE